MFPYACSKSITAATRLQTWQTWLHLLYVSSEHYSPPGAQENRKSALPTICPIESIITWLNASVHKCWRWKPHEQMARQ
jgi:hypothetical protein